MTPGLIERLEAAGEGSREKPLLAFAVQEDTEGSGGVVFAKTNAQARRFGACEFGDGDFHSVSARRAQWADKFAEQGWVPVAAYLDAGWYWYCSGCEKRIADGEEFGGEPDWTVDDVIEPRRGYAYHNQACYDAAMAYEAERTRRQQRAIERFKAIVQRRFPGVVFSQTKPGGLNPQHAFASRGLKGWYTSQVIVSFEFPGMTIAPATLRYERSSGKHNKPAYYVCGGDRDAFEAWAKSIKPAAILKARATKEQG